MFILANSLYLKYIIIITYLFILFILLLGLLFGIIHLGFTSKIHNYRSLNIIHVELVNRTNQGNK